MFKLGNRKNPVCKKKKGQNKRIIFCLKNLQKFVVRTSTCTECKGISSKDWSTITNIRYCSKEKIGDLQWQHELGCVPFPHPSAALKKLHIKASRELIQPNPSSEFNSDLILWEDISVRTALRPLKMFQILNVKWQNIFYHDRGRKFSIYFMGVSVNIISEFLQPLISV